MAATLRPLKEKDKKHFNSRVRAQYKADPIGTVECPIIFSAVDESIDEKKYRTQVQFYKRGHIELPIRIANPFLLSHNYSVVATVLDRKRSEIVSIANGFTVYSILEDRELQAKPMIDKTYEDTEYLIGGDYLKHLVENTNIDDRISEILLVHCIKSLYNSKDIKDLEKHEIGSVSCKESGLRILDDFYYHPVLPITKNNKNVISEIITEDYYIEVAESFEEGSSEEVEDNESITKDTFFGTVNSKLQVLLSMRGDGKQRVLDAFMSYIVVLPLGYRPTIENRKDPLTHQYNAILNCAIDVSNKLRQANNSVKSVSEAYFKLVNAVKTLMVWDKGNKTDGYKSLATALKGKTGIMRGELNSVITDGSGRTVITVDPTMPCNTVGVPYNMLEKLWELEIYRSINKNKINKMDILAITPEEKRIHIDRIAREALMPMGRQPTLYYLGIQSYKVKPVDGNAYVLNPLMTPAFNADFDGDTMYSLAAMRETSKKEVSDLMYCMNNVFLPRNGEIHLIPRQEMIYGLWQLTRVEADESMTPRKVTDSKGELSHVLEGVKSGSIKIDTPYRVITSKGIDKGVYSAGKIAFKQCLPKQIMWAAIGVVPLVINGDSRDDRKISESWFKELLKEIKINIAEGFVDTLNNIVELGFNIAENHPPNISTLSTDIQVDDLVNAFDNKIKEREELYNRGFYTIDEYSTYYSNEYLYLEKEVKRRVQENLGDSSGYYNMVVSGARGSVSNLVQLFGIKGRIMRSKTQSFNTAITNSLNNQLNSFEHFITAYGARQGILDKVVEVSEPGYVARRLGSSNNITSIVKHDCGTEDGIHLTFDRVREQIAMDRPYTEDILLYEDVTEYLVSVLVGRFIVGMDTMITEKNVRMIIESLVFQKKEDVIEKKVGVKLRSIITCKSPCCVKCYGINLGTQHIAVPGLPIGDLASQSISEPGTQSTMKKFQGGGLASKRVTATSFELLQMIIDNQIKRKSASDILEYDMLSPANGFIETVSRGDGTKDLKIMTYNDKGKKISAVGTKQFVIYDDIEVKKEIKIGESIQVVQGLLSPQEIATFRGIREAMEYIALTLFNLYRDDVFIDMKHFETIAISMYYKVCTRTGGEFQAGAFYPYGQYCKMKKGNAEFMDRLIGVKQGPKYKHNILEASFFEDLGTVMNRAVLTGTDDLTSPTVRAMLGLKINTGTSIEGYREGR